MRPTFLGFETARKALLAAQKGLDITGNNISNAETKGYTRQRVDQYSIYPPCSGYRYSVGNKSTAGHGVGITGIAQIRDPFLDNHFRLEYQEYGKLDTMTGGLNELETIFDEITSNGLTSNMDKMYAQLQKLSTDADRPEYANILMSSAKDIAFIFNTFSKDLDTMRDKEKFELDNTISKVNDITSKIAEMNQIIKDEFVTISAGGSSALGARFNEHYGPNELLDDRNLLLDELSSLVNIKTTTNSDGSVDVDMGGMMLVKGNEAGKLDVTPLQGENVDSSTKFEIKFSGRDSNDKLIFDKDVITDGNLTSGVIKGYMQTLTGKGSYADVKIGENSSFNGIPYYKGIIDSFAKTFSEAFNKANSYSEASSSVGGVSMTIRGDYAMDPVVNTVSFKQLTAGETEGAKWDNGKLVVTLDPAKKYNEATINKFIEAAKQDQPQNAQSVNVYFSGDLSLTANSSPISLTQKDQSLFEFKDANGNIMVDANGNTDARYMKVSDGWLKDPLGYLNTSKDLGAGDSHNNNILKMISLFDKKMDYTIPTTNNAEFNGTFKGFIKYYTAKLGQDTSFYEGLSKNKAAVAATIEERRFSVSSVDLNDEGVNMMGYQKSLNAASRFMTTLDEALDTIINNMGVVGR
ncbi:MAG: flagellar hook-associated protein FlgK [Oscillospiraceae bacterium]